MSSITVRKQAKTAESAAAKTSKTRKTCPGADPSIELPDPFDSFTRAFFRMPTMTIKYVSHSGSWFSWSGVAWHRFAFSKKAGWLEKTCPGADPAIELPDPFDSFSRTFLRMPSMTIKYVIEGPSNRTAGFLALLSSWPLYWAPAGPPGSKKLARKHTQR